jgi:anthranilate phosphoribosyltransferase
MGMRHRTLPLEGVQFHPESVLTPEGPHLLANFLRQAGEGEAGILDAATGTFATRGLTDPGSPDEPGPHDVPAPAPTVARAAVPGPTVAPAPGSPPAPVPAASAEAISEALHRVVDGETLSFDAARAAMGAVMDGAATPSQLAALLVALRMRGETVDELAGFAAAMRDRVVRVEAPAGTVDTCGTGGDRSGTFNISTAAALVVAAAGVPVAKHGNRAITSKSGSTDVLDALGIRIDHDATSAAAALREDGFAFLFAPSFHPAMRHAGPTRREIGVRTAFNLLGPLTNPAGARRQVIGVGAAEAAPRLAEVVRRLGTDRTLLVHGAGIDEIPLDGSGVVFDVTPGGVERRPVDAIALAALGIAPAATTDLAGGSPAENAALVEAVLTGETGPRRDVVLLNAAAALVAAGRVPDLREGVAVAAATIDFGRTTDLLARLRAARRTHEAATPGEPSSTANPTVAVHPARASNGAPR